jgi:hypothetical protein
MSTFTSVASDGEVCESPSRKRTDVNEEAAPVADEWEGKYKKLKAEYEAFKLKVARLEARRRDEAARVYPAFDGVQPVLSPEQRTLLVARVKAKVVDNRWTGKLNGQVCSVSFNNHQWRVQQVLLLAAGCAPHQENAMATTLCRNPRCCDVEHWCWCTPEEKRARLACFVRCKCMLFPSCLPYHE